MFNEEQQTIKTVEEIGPSVVSIVISKYMPHIKQTPLMPFGGMPFGIEAPDEQKISNENNNMDSIIGPSSGKKVKIGGGSGFIVNSNGLILTNKHVVFDESADYVVITSDEKKYPAKILCRDPVNDIGFIKIDAKNLPVANLGESKSIQLGQTVLAVGNALGIFTNSVSKGIISGLSRRISASMGSEPGSTKAPKIENLRNVIQTDVAINQGNSGGPLINLDGEVIGINTAVIYGAQNIGFAIPIDWAKTDIEDLKKHGHILRPYMGVRYIMLNSELKNMYQLPLDYGALVVKDHIPGSVAVVLNSPADKAGIKENDVILTINNLKLDGKKDISDVIQESKVGDEIKIEIMRNGKRIKTKTTLEKHK